MGISFRHGLLVLLPLACLSGCASSEAPPADTNAGPQDIVDVGPDTHVDSWLEDTAVDLGPADTPVDILQDVAEDVPGDTGGPDLQDSGPADTTDTEVEPDLGTDTATDDGGGQDPVGSWENPIVVPSLPFQHQADTNAAPSFVASAYSPCAPGTNESGGEFVYEVAVIEAGTLTVSVDDTPGDAIDVDVHLLSAPSPDACMARDNISVARKVEAGTYWVAVDTWVNSSGAVLAGPYVLTITWAQGGTTPCTQNPIPDCDENDKPLVNGVPSEEPGAEGCPGGMVGITDQFCIDRYEAMLVRLDGGGQLSSWSPYENPGSETVMAMSVFGMVPQGYIDQLQAKAACETAGKRLCTDSEWLRACQGPDGYTYPYGQTRQPKVCNDSRSCHPAVQYFESTADWIWSNIGHPCINQLPDGLANTGSYAGCVTVEGVHDMMGNLHEWTADPSGTFRGGYYVDTVINGSGCLYRTTAHSVYHWDYSTGFRCCADRW